MQLADIKNDIAFHKIFGNENRKEVLISFLNSVLAFEEEDQRITAVTIMNPYQLPKLKGGKVTIVDIKATDQAKRQYIVEMQVAEKEGFDKRVLYYLGKSYTDQIKRGDFYRKLKPAIFIGILNFVETENLNYISRSQVIDIETGERTIKDIEFNYIELPKFNLAEHELTTLTEKWIYFIKNAENLTFVPENVDDEGLKSAYEEANQNLWSKEELEAYDYVYMREEDTRAELDAAEQKGEKQGKIEIAREMKKEGELIEKIKRYTGLSENEIDEL